MGTTHCGKPGMAEGGGTEEAPPPSLGTPGTSLTRQMRLPPGTPSLPSCAAKPWTTRLSASLRGDRLGLGAPSPRGGPGALSEAWEVAALTVNGRKVMVIMQAWDGGGMAGRSLPAGRPTRPPRASRRGREGTGRWRSPACTSAPGAGLHRPPPQNEGDSPG